jgi:hypothetical protein
MVALLVVSATLLGINILSAPAKAAILSPTLTTSATGHSASNSVTITVTVNPTVEAIFFVRSSAPTAHMVITDSHSDTFTQIGNQSSIGIRTFIASIGSTITYVSATVTGATWVQAEVAFYRYFSYVSHVTDFSSGSNVYRQLSVIEQSTHETAVGVLYAPLASTVNVGQMLQNDSFGSAGALSNLFLIQNVQTEFLNVTFRLAIGITSTEDCSSCNGVILGVIPNYQTAFVNAIIPYCIAWFGGQNSLTVDLGAITYKNDSDVMAVFLLAGDHISSIGDGGDTFVKQANGSYGGWAYIYTATWHTGRNTLTVVFNSVVTMCISVEFYRNVYAIGDAFIMAVPSDPTVEINANMAYGNSIMASSMFAAGATLTPLHYEGFDWFDNVNTGTDYSTSAGYNSSTVAKNLKYGNRWFTGTSGATLFMLEIRSYIVPPSVVTESASSITHYSAVLHGNMTTIGTEDSATLGFIWSSNKTLSADIHNVTYGVLTGNGPFDVGISTFHANTTYYFKAWVNSSQGFSNGSILNFTTSSQPTFTINGMDIGKIAILIVFFFICVTAVVLAFGVNKRMTHRRGSRR